MTDPRQAAYDRRTRELDMQARQHKCICQVCGSKLVMPYDPVTRSLVLRCGQDKSHVGIVEQKSYYQLWKEGVGVPLEVAQKFQEFETRRK